MIESKKAQQEKQIYHNINYSDKNALPRDHHC